MKQIEQAQDRHLNGVDLTFVLGVDEFLGQSVPSWLSGEKAIAIYQEIKDLTMKLVTDEFERTSRKIDIFDVEDEEADVIRYKALDSVCLKYKIEEEQLKHVLYITYIVPNQQEMMQSEFGDESSGGGMSQRMPSM